MSSQGRKRLITGPLAQPAAQGTLLTFAIAISAAMLMVSACRSIGRGELEFTDGSTQGVTGDSCLLIDINTAAAGELAVLPGIGPVLARRIVEDRRHRGEFLSVQDLQRVFGVGPKTVRQIDCYCVAANGAQNTEITADPRRVTQAREGPVPLHSSRSELQRP